MLASAHDPLTPPSLFIVAPAAPPVLLRQAPHAFDTNGLVVTRHDAVSSDGTRIPYVQAGPPGETGEAPVHLTAMAASTSRCCRPMTRRWASSGSNAAAPA